MRPTRLLCLSPNLNGGGAERVMIHVLRGLDRSRFVSTLALGERTGPFADQVPKDVPVIEFGHLRSYRAIPALARLLRSGEFDVVFSMTAMNLAVVLARAASRTRVPIVLGARNHYSSCLPIEASFPAARKLAVRALYPRADLVIGVARGVSDDLVANFGVPRAKAIAIPNPLDLVRLREMAAEDPGHPWLAPGGPKTIVTAGALKEAKGHGDLLRAFARVRERVDARLIIIGQGPLKAELERIIAELGLKDVVELAGFQQNPYAWMARASVFVLSSHWEGFPNVLTEAMASGAPVVSTDCPSGPSEIVHEGETGLLVPVADTDRLAQAIVRVLEDDALRERLRTAGKADVAQYDLPLVVEQYAAAFESVSAAPRARA